MWYTQVLGRLYLPMENNLSFSLKHSKWKTQFNSGVNISFHKPFVLFKSIFPFCTMSRFSPSLAQPISIRVQKKASNSTKKLLHKQSLRWGVLSPTIVWIWVVPLILGSLSKAVGGALSRRTFLLLLSALLAFHRAGEDRKNWLEMRMKVATID